MTRNKSRNSNHITKGTKEWAESNINWMFGCSHNCLYCYAKKMAIQYKRETEKTWPNERPNFKTIHKKRFGKHQGTIMLPTSHDITPANLHYALDIIEKLLVAGNRLLITTKPHLKCVIAICKKFKEYKNLIQFRFTITSIDDLTLIKWEPGAPHFKERMMALIYAFKAGFNTSISMEPCLDLDPRPLVERISPYVTGKIWIGAMNWMGEFALTKIETLQTWLGYFAGNDKIVFKDTIINKIEAHNQELEVKAQQKLAKQNQNQHFKNFSKR